MINRIAAFIHLAVATVISIIYIPFPEMCDAVMFHLVKNTEHLILNGEPRSKQFCKCVQADGEDACSVVEENEPSDGEDRSDDEHESDGDGEREPDGCKDD